ncbi:hypothetical protein BKA62DRAFT_834886 [Auriculariales sp. MPI-PUGE-AT-0066]|nr:hypothetical protein BKA62DRAFT_834886 [Auriculariales sp. MPI-PUGE-AT-0066]
MASPASYVDPPTPTLLERFIECARGPDGWRPVVRSGENSWAYADLDRISNGIAADLRDRLAKTSPLTQPIVAIVSLNDPFVIALSLAAWKVGAVFAPLDPNVPLDLLFAMLANIGPSIIYDMVNSSDVHRGKHTAEVITGPLESMTTLERRYTAATFEMTGESLSPAELALYVHTSSATGPHNIKCVPITHELLGSCCAAVLGVTRKYLPNEEYHHLRVLGMSPLSHSMALCMDLGPWTYGTRGCYVFPNPSSQQDLVGAVVDTLLNTDIDAFLCIPFVAHGVKERYQAIKNSTKAAKMAASLQRLRFFATGGAQADRSFHEWASEMNLRLFECIGSTETGPLFYNPIDLSSPGSRSEDCTSAHAEYYLVDELGNRSEDSGELVVVGKHIRGYLNRSDMAFKPLDDGQTAFYTGDIYTKSSEGRMIWDAIFRGKTRPSTNGAGFASLVFVSNAVVVGDKFLNGPSEHICIMVELETDSFPLPKSDIQVLVRTVGRENALVTPSLRVPWSRIILLPQGSSIPLNRKKATFRKRLQELHGRVVADMLRDESSDSRLEDSAVRRSFGDAAEIQETVVAIISNALGMDKSLLKVNMHLNFAEVHLRRATGYVLIRSADGLDVNSCDHHRFKHQRAICAFLATERMPRASHAHALVQHVLVQLRIVASTDTAEDQAPDQLNPEIQDDDVVIVGQAVRLPGDVDDGETLWRTLCEKRDVLTNVPSDRWDHASFYRDPNSTAPEQPGDITFRKAGFINVAEFDNAFFGIPSTEALSVTPSNRLALEAGFAALEDANIPPSKLKGSDTGVFASAGMDAPGLLDVHGPSVAIDTACSGGLVALDQAVRYLRLLTQSAPSWWLSTRIAGLGNSRYIVGELALCNFHKRCGWVRSQCRLMAEPYVFSRYVPSEGAVAFVVKKVGAAKRDSNRILGVIRSTVVGHNGRSQGIAAPNQRAQIALQKRALKEAGLRPCDIHFVEAHGTGTKLGDLIEIQGITDVFKHRTRSAAGLVGTAAALQYLNHRAVPGLMHMTEHNINSSIELDAVPLALSGRTTRLADSPMHRGLVLSFGLAGTIAAAVIESAPTTTQLDSHWKGQPLLFVISAKSEPALLAYIEQYIAFCESASEDALASICYTSCVGREHYNVRFACVPTSLRNLIHTLRTRSKASPAPRPPPTDRAVTFVFPGQGLHFHGMARDLAKFSGFDAILRVAAKEAQLASDCPHILDYLLGKDHEQDDAIHNTLNSRSSSTIVAGILSFEIAVDLVVQRERLLRHDNGAMAVVALSASAVNALAVELELSDLTIAVYNSPSSHVISGLKSDVECFVTQAKLRGVRATTLPLQAAFHSQYIEPGLEGLRQWSTKHADSFSRPTMPFISSTLGRSLKTLPPGYWVQHARSPVHFDMAVAAVHSGVILDIGPQPATWAIIQSSVPPTVTALCTTTKKTGNQLTVFFEFIAQAFQLGLTLQFDQLLESLSQPPEKVVLPTYPYQRRRFWPAVRVRRGGPEAVPEVEVASPSIFRVSQDLLDLLADHAVGSTKILPAAAMLNFIFSTRQQRQFTQVNFHRPLQVTSTSSQMEFTDDGSGSFQFVDSQSRDTVCSGTLKSTGVSHIRSRTAAVAPIETISQQETYRRIGGFAFGQRFRNIQSIILYPAYAEVVISVSETEKTSLRQILVLDAVLHGFGAISDGFHTGTDDILAPASLQGVTLHQIGFPSVVVVRYYFPRELSNDGLSASVSLDVFALDGTPVLSCDKYTVARVPRIIFTGETQRISISSTLRLATRWTKRSVVSPPVAPTMVTSSLFVVVIGSPNSPFFEACKAAWPSSAIEAVEWSLFAQRNKISHSHSHLANQPLIVVIDFSQASQDWELVATLLKSLISDRLDIQHILTFTTEDVYGHGDRGGSVAIAEGMFRVFLSEAGMRSRGRIIRFPSGSLSSAAFATIIKSEEGAAGMPSPTVVSWRADEANELVRFIPMLEPIPQVVEPPTLSGVCVIAGMGSIGRAIAVSLLKDTDVTKVIFLGRKQADDPSVLSTISSIGEAAAYVTADIRIRSEVLQALEAIGGQYGPIRIIVHTAAVVHDQRLDQLDTQTAQSVLDPKVIGAWNLHQASLDLGCPLERFVLLSSISVPLGNSGQTAYVAANAFLDWLAALRQSASLPAVSLQLGPWQSALVERDDVAAHHVVSSKEALAVTSHEAGIPLILAAIANPDAVVEVIASFDLQECINNPTFAEDSIFEKMLCDVTADTRRTSAVDAKEFFMHQLSNLLGHDSSDPPLDLTESLISLGVDSILFAQLRAKMLSELGISVPLKFLSYDYRLQDVLATMQG